MTQLTDKFSIHSSQSHILPPKKLYVSQATHLQPPASKIFIAFTVNHIEKSYIYITNCQFHLAVICCPFVCLVAAHRKSHKFPKLGQKKLILCFSGTF